MSGLQSNTDLEVTISQLSHLISHNSLSEEGQHALRTAVSALSQALPPSKTPQTSRLQVSPHAFERQTLQRLNNFTKKRQDSLEEERRKKHLSDTAELQEKPSIHPSSRKKVRIM